MGERWRGIYVNRKSTLRKAQSTGHHSPKRDLLIDASHSPTQSATDCWVERIP
jgi:hypothetical protein